MKYEVSLKNNMISCSDAIYHCYACKDALISVDLCLQGCNLYGIKGAIGSGNWALAESIAKSSDEIAKCEAVYFDHNASEETQTKEYICDINSRQLLLNFEGCTVQQCLEDILISTKSDLSIDKVKEYFRLTEERYFRKIENIGIEIYRLIIAFGFIRGEKIYVMPFIGVANVNILFSVYEILVQLAKAGNIIIVPYDETLQIDYLFDRVIETKGSKIKRIRSIGRIYRVLWRKQTEFKVIFRNLTNKLIYLVCKKSRKESN